MLKIPTNGNISNSINWANISAEFTNNLTANIGGVLGKSGNLISCYNLGNINVKNTSNYCKIGGILGNNSFTSENIYNTGTISYSEGATVGLMCGNNTGTILNGKYLNKSNLIGIGNNTGTDNTECVNSINLMPDVLSIVGNKFKSDNDGNPILSWQ